MPARDWLEACKVRRGRWFTCTLPAGHAGPHIAHADPAGAVALVWADVPTPPVGLLGWVRS